MKTHFSCLLALLALTALSCTKEARTEIVPIPGLLNISFSTENPEIPLSGGDVCWSKNDTIMVFDEGNSGVKFSTREDQVNQAVFSTFIWSDKKPAYASLSSLPTKEASCENGVLTVRIPEEQPITDRNFPSEGTLAAVGKVTGTTGAYSVDAMKNVSGLIRITFENPNAAAIRVESNAGEPVAGVVKADYNKLAGGDNNFWAPVSGKTTTAITLRPSTGVADANGCFKPDSFYVAVLPQTYAKGLRFSLLDKQGKTILSKSEGYEGGLTILRNDINVPESGLDDNLPAVIQVNLDFYNPENVNPLGEFAAVASQTINGEDYPYVHHYIQDGEEKTMDLVFGLCKGSASGANGYLYTPHNASFYGKGDGLSILNINNGAINGAAGTSPFWIRIPGIKGRSLDVVILHIGNGAAKNLEIRETPEGEAVFKASSTAGSTTALGAATFNNKGAGMKLKPGVPYYVVFTSKNGYQFYDLQVTYSR